jgi:nucleotide-binding universal stress UspA family protein
MLPPLKKILYATDLSETSIQAFRYALSLAQQYEGKINVVHIQEYLGRNVEAMIDLYITPEQKAARLQESIEATRQEVLDFCDKETCNLPAGPDLIDQVFVYEGVPYEEILKKAKETEADLIVMGQHGHSALTDMLLGGTARRVLHNSHLPVLLVRLHNK